MYEQYFGLSEPAFSLTPDPRLMWLSATHEEGLATLVYGVTRRKGFLLLTGEVGAGKTTLLRAALESFPEDVETALIFHTAGMTAFDLLKMIAAELRVEGPFESKSDCVLGLQRFLMERMGRGLNTVVVIDEAQNLDETTLEEIRLLSNMETDREKLLQIVLTGQPELLEKLSSPALTPLRQRIALQHHVGPIEPHEVHAYLAHRIHVAGGEFESVFAPGVEPLFYEFSQGRPRLMNILADRVLLASYAKQIRPVPQELVKAKVESLAWLRSAEEPG